MQDILALAGTYRDWSAGMQYAAALAAAGDAALTGVFVCEPIVPLASMNTPMAFPELYTIGTEIAAQARAAEPEFLAWAQARGVKDATWLVAEGYLTHVLAHAANWNDLLVLERGGASAFGNLAALGHVLLTCGLPCCVIPEDFSAAPRHDTIALAWTGSPESVRAMHAALPLLRSAGRVLLLEGKRPEPLSTVDLTPALDVSRYLARQSVPFDRAEVRIDSEADAGAELLRLAGAAHADLLVMGAYGRTRFSEWVLGGATRHVLEHSRLPLFMRH